MEARGVSCFGSGDMGSCEPPDWAVGATLRSSVRTGCTLKYRVIIPKLSFYFEFRLQKL